MTAEDTIEVDSHRPQVAVVTLRGEHDLGSRYLEPALALAGDHKSVLVDLSAATFVDVSVINALLCAARRTRGAGRRLELVVATEPRAVRRVLELTNVAGRLPMHETLAIGLAQIGRSGPTPSGWLPGVAGHGPKARMLAEDS